MVPRLIRIWLAAARATTVPGLLLALAAVSCTTVFSGPPSSLALVQATGQQVVFAVKLRAGDSVCITYGPKGQMLCAEPKKRTDSHLIIMRQAQGFQITGGLLARQERGAMNVTFLPDIKPAGGRYLVGHYDLGKQHGIPIYVGLQTAAEASPPPAKPKGEAPPKTPRGETTPPAGTPLPAPLPRPAPAPAPPPADDFRDWPSTPGR